MWNHVERFARGLTVVALVACGSSTDAPIQSTNAVPSVNTSFTLESYQGKRVPVTIVVGNGAGSTTITGGDLVVDTPTRVITRTAVETFTSSNGQTVRNTVTDTLLFVRTGDRLAFFRGTSGDTVYYSQVFNGDSLWLTPRLGGGTTTYRRIR